jgi:hypothetical protein
MDVFEDLNGDQETPLFLLPEKIDYSDILSHFENDEPLPQHADHDRHRFDQIAPSDNAADPCETTEQDPADSVRKLSEMPRS